ncbi:MAG: MEthanogen/methylotroph, DcmR Sensory domain [Deltaproteobacteria bacterium]|nr:MEthanogen/methylotroph, DcmR Sensory domain [Deltaproteobacteria bacterium]
MAPKKEVLMGFTGKTFPPGTHICYIYNDEDERNRIIYRFLESGLLNGENVSYFMDINTADEMKEHQAAMSADKLYKEQKGHFSLATTKEAYCPTGIFIPDDMLDRLSEFYTQSMDEGYTGARASGEMSWAARGGPGSSRLMEYEARLNSTFMKCPVTAICQYHANLFDNDMLRDVLAVHPMIICHGQIVRNPYYIKSWWLLKRFLGLDER